MDITASKHINNQNNGKVCTSLFHYVRPSRGKDCAEVEMYGLLSVGSSINIPGSQVIKFAWDGIVDGFEYSNIDSFNESLKAALQESTRRLKQLITSDSEMSKEGVDINFAVFVFNQKTVYVGMLGESDIFVYKNGRVVDISEMLIQKQARTAGLVMNDGDMLIAGTRGTIQKNMNRIVGQKNKECIKEKVREIEGSLEAEEGYVTFESGAVEEKPEECIEENVAKESEVSLEDLAEPVTSDYISLSKEKAPLLHIQKPEKDLKYFVYELSLRLGKTWYKVSSRVQPFLYSISQKVKNALINLGGDIKRKLLQKRYFKKISATVTQNNVGRKAADTDLKGLKIDGYKRRDKRFQRFKTVFMIIGAATLVVLGVKFTMDQKEARAIHKQAEGVFTEVDSLVNKAEGKVYTDRNSTETYIFKAQDELAKVPQGLNEEDSARRTDLEGRVLGLQDDLYKRAGLQESNGSIEPYLDSRLAFGEGSKATDVALYKDNKNNEYLIIVDPGLKAVYRVSLYNKEVKKLPDTNGVLKKPSFVYIGQSGVFVLDEEVGVVRAKYDDNGWFGTFETITGLGINSLGTEDIAEFAVLTESDNIYIVDRAKKALLKSTNFGSGYGLSFSYISNDSFDKANEVLSDLSVYILTSGSDGLRRYNYSYTEQKQVSAPVTVVGVNGEFKNLQYGYTQQSLDYGLYVFDSEDRRVLKFEKPKEGGGETRHPNQVVLEKQYIYRGTKEDVWGSVHDLVVDSKEQYMYILDGLTVWKARL